MTKSPSFQFYPGDWLRNDVSGCSLEAQGLWLRMMMVMHDAQIYGQLVLNNAPMSPQFIAKKIGISVKKYNYLLKELDFAGVINRKENGVIFSGRMERDERGRQQNRDRQAEHYKKTNGKPNGNLTPKLTPVSRKPNAKPNGASSSSTSTSIKKEEKEIRPQAAKPADERHNHPAIVNVREVTGTYPPKEIWDELIGRLGVNIDLVKLKRCYSKWRVLGFKKTNYNWALDWYIDGIPEQQGNKTNGTNRKYNNGRRTDEEVVDESKQFIQEKFGIKS
jgi:DNA-binding Lrp family transcriptional regulator